MYTAVQSQKAVSAHFTSEQILHFSFADKCERIGVVRGQAKYIDLILGRCAEKMQTAVVDNCSSGQ